MTTSPLATLLQSLKPIPQVQPQFAGIYFLFDGEEIVYVGQSTNIPARVKHHVFRPLRMVFGAAAWLEVDASELDAYEGAFIRLLRPRYNTKYTKDDSRDEEIRIRFNIPPPDDKAVRQFERRRRKVYAAPQKAKRELRISRLRRAARESRWQNSKYLYAALQRMGAFA